MYKETKEALKKITIADATCGVVYGRLLLDIYFLKEEMALLFNNRAESYSILVKKKSEQNQSEKEFEETSKLVELISYLQRLEKENLIYIVLEKTNDVYLLYQGCTIEGQGTLAGQYILSDGRILGIDKGIYYIENNGEVLLSSLREESSLYVELKRYLCSRVYPTSGLKEYIEGGFKNEDQRQAAEANRLSRNSICLAWFAAIVSPFASLILGNCLGITTIDKKQFDKIIQTITIDAEPANKDVSLQTISQSLSSPATVVHKDSAIISNNQKETTNGKQLYIQPIRR